MAIINIGKNNNYKAEKSFVPDYVDYVIEREMEEHLKEYDEHMSNTDNPHKVKKSQVGLSNVDNTSDLNKPISTATQAALDKKANQTDVDSIKNNTTLIKNGSGGFSAGDNADTEMGSSAGRGSFSTTGGASGHLAQTQTGGAVGQSTKSTSGGAVGTTAQTQTGGAVGTSATSTDGGAIGSMANTTTGGAVGEVANSESGGAVGFWASSESGGAVGNNTGTSSGGAIGNNSHSGSGASVGENTSSTTGGAIGADAKAGAGFAGGKAAKAVDSSGGGIDAIQLGTGTNSVPKTLQAYGYQLMDANGKIPLERLSNVPQTVEELEVTANDIFTADELDAFTCGMEEARAAVIKQHYIDESTGSGTAYGNAMFITVESDTATYDGHPDGHPILEQTLYCSPGHVYTRTGTNKNDGSMLYEWENWELEKNFVSDAPGDGTLYGRKDGGWEELTSLHTHANKAILDATEVAYTENEQARIGTLESDLDTFYTDLNDLQNTAVTDAPSDGNTYGRKDGAWENLSGEGEQMLVNFIDPTADGSTPEDTTNLDDLPNGITVVRFMIGADVGGYIVMTARTSPDGVGNGYQFKISSSGIESRWYYGEWGAWSKIG